MDFGLPELIIILLIILLLFGGTRLPKLAHSLGKSIRDLREGFEGKESAAKNTPRKENENTASNPVSREDVTAENKESYSTATEKTESKNKV